MSSNSFKVTYIIHGKSHEVDVEEGRTLLDGALIAKIEPPFSCLEGICGTCEARVSDGEVQTLPGYESEVDPKRVKTCQTFPKSSRVTVNYDDLD